MANELEVKILDINKAEVESVLVENNATKIQDTKLEVYWYGVKDRTESPEWFLRIRRYKDGKNEVTWKGKSTILGLSRTHKEINFLTDQLEPVKDLLHPPYLL